MSEAAETGDLVGNAAAEKTEKEETTSSEETSTEETSTEETQSDDTPADKASDDAGGKSEEDKATEPVVPDTYDLKAPEGMTLDEHLVAAATPLFKENKWSNETAQQAVDAFMKVREAEAAAFEEMKTNQDADLRKTLGNDYEPTQRRVGALLAAYKSQVGEQDHNALVETLVDHHGLGSNGVMVKFLDWMAKGLKSEDSISGTQSTPGEDPKAAESDRLARKYPTMHKEDGTPKAHDEA